MEVSNDAGSAHLDAILDKCRKSTHQFSYCRNHLEIAVLESDAVSRCTGAGTGFWGQVRLDRGEKAALAAFGDEEKAKLLRAFEIRQARPWEAPGGNQEIVDEIIAQLKLATPTEDFLTIDYYVKQLRPYPQLWDSPAVEGAVVNALQRVGDVVKLFKDETSYEYREYSRFGDGEYRLAVEGAVVDTVVKVFKDEVFGGGDLEFFGGREYKEPLVKAAVDRFEELCEAIIKACHKTDAATRKRNRDAFESEFASSSP